MTPRHTINSPWVLTTPSQMRRRDSRMLLDAAGLLPTPLPTANLGRIFFYGAGTLGLIHAALTITPDDRSELLVQALRRLGSGELTLQCLVERASDFCRHLAVER